MGHLRLEITVRTKALASRGRHDVGRGRAEQPRLRLAPGRAHSDHAGQKHLHAAPRQHLAQHTHLRRRAGPASGQVPEGAPGAQITLGSRASDGGRSVHASGPISTAQLRQTAGPAASGVLISPRAA